jgi:hypothetical protein
LIAAVPATKFVPVNLTDVKGDPTGTLFGATAVSVGPLTAIVGVADTGAAPGFITAT